MHRACTVLADSHLVAIVLPTVWLSDCVVFIPVKIGRAISLATRTLRSEPVHLWRLGWRSNLPELSSFVIYLIKEDYLSKTRTVRIVELEDLDSEIES